MAGKRRAPSRLSLGFCSLEVHAAVETVCNLVQVAGLSIKDVTERDEWGDVSVMNSGRENRISSPLGFLRSASSMVNLSLFSGTRVFCPPFLII
jgi:hypothetical protein